MKKPPIKFLYTGYEPMLGGCLRTPIMCCLEDYRTLVWGQRDLVYASYHLSHPMIMYEDKPPAGGAREDEKAQYSNLSLVGGDHPIYDFDTPAGIHWREVRNFFFTPKRPRRRRGRFGEKRNMLQNKNSSLTLVVFVLQQVRTKEVEAQLAAAGMLVQENQAKSRGSVPWIHQDDPITRARESFVHNRVVLPADRHFAGQLKADTVIDIEKMDMQLTIKAAELIGISVELTQSTNKVHAANKEGNPKSPHTPAPRSGAGVCGIWCLLNPFLRNPNGDGRNGQGTHFLAQ